MKQLLFLMALLFLASCQDELYKNPQKEFKSEQGVYVVNKSALQTFAEEGKDMNVSGMQVALAVQDGKSVGISLETGDQAQLDAYNKKNQTSYILLPTSMYEVPSQLVFEPQFTSMDVPIKLKDLKFSMEGKYALPVKIKSSDVNVIPGEDEAMLVLEQRINTKVLRFGGTDTEDASMFPSDFKVDQWTMEIMINRAYYNQNNQALCGTKLVENAGTMDEIYTRFGDVTIKPNQLQIKTGSSQIDVPADKFSAQPDTWYMISFVYDGKYNYVYVNGVEVAKQEIRTGPYGLIGFWISGANHLAREVRFWKTARTQQEIASTVWTMVNPDDDNLLLYYPLNGKRRDGTEDETKIWDWSKSGKDLPMPARAAYDDNGGNGYIFPLPE